MTGETRIALMAKTRLVELIVERPDTQSFVGNIYHGRIEKVLPGIQAAFVDIGLTRSGFLAASEVCHHGDKPVASINKYVSEGDDLLVQVQRDPFEEKGVKLTAKITLPGRFVVYTPGQEGIKVSRRITDNAQRARLSALLESMIDGGDGGFIVRTSALKADDDELRRDVEFLHSAWEEIKHKRVDGHPPNCLYRGLDPLRQILRDEANQDIEEIIGDNAKVLGDIRGFCQQLAPDIANKVKLHNSSQEMFESHGVEEQIEAALVPRVMLSSGANIIINQTAALIAIDVNIGAAAHMASCEETAQTINLEAADEIARQIRLRNLSGLIVIDFVSMKRHDHEIAVIERLRQTLAGDSCPTYISGFSGFGLVEMTRSRRRRSLSAVLCGECSSCAGVGLVKSPQTIAFEVLRAVKREALHGHGMALAVCASPQVIDVLNGPAIEALRDMQEHLGRALELRPVDAPQQDYFEVLQANK